MIALLQILLRGVQGRAVRLIRLLRQPKYLVGTVIAVAWMLFWLGQAVTSSMSTVMFADVMSKAQAIGPTLHFAAGGVLALWLSSTWLVPFGRLGLSLTQADLHVLLPAPVTRRSLIQYALAKAQGPILLTSLLFSLLLSDGSLVSYLRSFVSVWLCFTFLEWLNRLRGMLLTQIRGLGRRKALVWRIAMSAFALALMAIVAVRIATIAAAMFGSVSEAVRGDGGVEGVFHVLADLPVDPLLSIVLAPFMWVLAPFFAEDAGSFLFSSARLAAMIVVVHELIVRNPVRFEEPALRHADEMQRKETSGKSRSSSRTMRYRAVFSLRPRGIPEVAILWKNLMLVTRIPWYLLAAGFVALGIALAILLPALPIPAFLYGIPASIALFTFALSPLMAAMSFRNDLRHDLPYFEVVRTWPIEARRFIWAEIAAVVSAAQLVAGLSAAVLMGSLTAAYLAASRGIDANLKIVSFWGESAAAQLTGVALVLVSALPAATALATLIAALQNFATLSFPAWIPLGDKSPKGIAASGQYMLIGSALGLVLAFASIPSALLVGMQVLAHWLFGFGFAWWDLPLGGVLIALPYLTEAWFVVNVCTRLWRDFDPSDEVLSPPA